MTTQFLENPELAHLACEAAIVARCHAHLVSLDPAWVEQLDDAHLPTADRGTIADLLRTAPDDFARGLMYGHILARLELAQATGRPFD